MQRDPTDRFVLRVAGWIGPLIDTSSFVASQVPSRLPSAPMTSTSQVLALQLANCYGLLALIGLGVLYYTNEATVVRNYLLACAVGDVGHMASTYWVIGHANFVNFKAWNATAWGNIGFTAFLLLTRMFYLAGFFGKDKVVQSARKKL